MKQSCDAGTLSPAMINSPVKGRKKNRRNRKKLSADIAAIPAKENTAAENGGNEHEPEKKENEITVPPLSTPEEVFSGSVRTDIALDKNEHKEGSEGSGIIYEIAEELYLREKTLARLEALCAPPFEKRFTSSQKNTLDDEADERLDRLTRAAAKKQRTLTFLPEGTFEEENKPISTLQAFILQFVMLIPALNIIFAGVLLLLPHTNQSIRSFCRALLIWSGIVLLILFIYLISKLTLNSFLDLLY